MTFFNTEQGVEATMLDYGIKATVLFSTYEEGK